MKRGEQQVYYQLGNDYWWLVGKYKVIQGCLDRHVAQDERHQMRVLDAGCGPGNMLDLLSQYGQVIGVDSEAAALTFCHTRGFRDLCYADICNLPVGEDSLDLVVAIDVLEHLDDDMSALAQLHRVGRSGGWVCITVPAYEFLRGDHDDIFGHKRRYTLREVRSKLEQAGFSMKWGSYLHCAPVVPLWLFRRLRRSKDDQTKTSDFIALPRWLNWLLTQYMMLEAIVLRGTRLPFGATVICLAQKPSRPTPERESKAYDE
jgi:SAM-dependent methyltransferase